MLLFKMFVKTSNNGDAATPSPYTISVSLTDITLESYVVPGALNWSYVGMIMCLHLCDIFNIRVHKTT